MLIFTQPVKEVSLDLLKYYSKTLADAVHKDGFTPDHVLFVERAGLLIGDEIAKYFGCSIGGIATQRYGGTTKSKFKFILRYSPRVLTHFLRQIEVLSSFHEVQSERSIVTEYPLPGKGKKVLVVDDAIDTGYSIKAVIDYLLNEGYDRNLMRVAVITTTSKTPAFRADYSLFDQVICAFPWSYDSRQYDQTWSEYKSKKELICENIQMEG